MVSIDEQAFIPNLRTFCNSVNFDIVETDCYSPLPDEKARKECDDDKIIDGGLVNWNSNKMLSFLESILEATPQMPYAYNFIGHGYYVRNGMFGYTSARILHALVNYNKPKRIIEIGSGFSSLVIDNAISVGYSSQEKVVVDFSTINLDYKNFGGTSLLHGKAYLIDVTTLDSEYFSSLQAGDILFIDTSHTVKTGGDVVYLFTQILPYLNKGVYIHFHDIFLPFDYPKEWIVEKRRAWAEQYMLLAFLHRNEDFHILFSEHFLRKTRPDELEELIPRSTDFDWNYYSSSFWMRKER